MVVLGLAGRNGAADVGEREASALLIQEYFLQQQELTMTMHELVLLQAEISSKQELILEEKELAPMYKE